MKITKARLKQIIKEEIEQVREGDIPPSRIDTGEPRKEPMTEYELYAHFSPIVKRLIAFRDDMDYASGVESGINTLQLPDELYNDISRTIFKLEKLRIKMAQAIGQDPHPNMRD